MELQPRYASLSTAVLLFYLLLCLISHAVSGRSLQNSYNRKNGVDHYSGGGGDDVVAAALKEEEDDVASQFVEPQNEARARVGDPPLVWDAEVANYAEKYAAEREGDCALQHSNGPYGENIFWGSGSAWQAKDAVAAWIGEDKNFNYHTHSCNGYEECGHYTQIVWKNSVRVGCAKVICNDGDTFITCNYDPPGNYIGQKPY